MAKRILFILSTSLAFLCSEIDIGTDVDKIGNVVSEGVVQEGWNYHDASYKSSPPQGEVYFYVKGLELLGPTFEVTEFHHEDEYRDDSHKWVFMNVTVDEKIDGLFKDFTAYKVTQECVDREGGSTIHMNITFSAITCDPITINWLKVCGEPTATRAGLNIGLSKKSSEIVTNGVVTSTFDGNTKNNVYKVATDEATTKIYMYHSDLFSKTFYNEPYIITDHEVMYPTLVGTMGKSGWVEGEILFLEITYNCLVDDGIKEELILVVELPYYHDLEIHFFKTCGVKAVSSGRLSTILFIVGVVGLGFCLAFGYDYFRREENSFDFRQGKETLKSGIEYFTSMFKKEPIEPPEVDDDGKVGLNVHTMYGTV